MQPNMPQGAPAPEAPAREPGGASQLVADIHSKMVELMDLVSSSPDVDDGDKQALGGVIAGYQSFVDGLSAPPGAKAPASAPQAPMRGPAPMEAGANPNVKPAL